MLISPRHIVSTDRIQYLVHVPYRQNIGYICYGIFVYTVVVVVVVVAVVVVIVLVVVVVVVVKYFAVRPTTVGRTPLDE